MIMMPYGSRSSSPQLTGHANFWHSTGLVYMRKLESTNRVQDVLRLHD